MYWVVHPRRPRDFPRPERCPEGEAQGKSRGLREISRAEGMDFTIPPEFWWSTDILLIINPSTGMDQEIHPSRQGRIDSVKINPSLLRMRECCLHTLSHFSSNFDAFVCRISWVSSMRHRKVGGGPVVRHTCIKSF